METTSPAYISQGTVFRKGVAGHINNTHGSAIAPNKWTASYQVMGDEYASHMGQERRQGAHSGGEQLCSQQVTQVEHASYIGQEG